jgi:ketosteroid isomerase-like protein
VVNRGDIAAFTKLWSEDATLVMNRKETRGRAAIVEQFRRLVDDSEWIVQTAPLMLFEVDEEHGDGTGRVTVQERRRLRKAAKATSSLATYHDNYVRRGTSWVFSRREVESLDGA